MLRGRGLGMRGEVTGTEAIRRTVLAGTNIFGEPASVLFRRAALIDVGGWDGRFPYLIDLATYCAVLLAAISSRCPARSPRSGSAGLNGVCS